jgi:hypothetical protein
MAICMYIMCMMEKPNPSFFTGKSSLFTLAMLAHQRLYLQRTDTPGTAPLSAYQALALPYTLPCWGWKRDGYSWSILSILSLYSKFSNGAEVNR